MQKAIYTTVGIEELLSHVQALKGVGARFVQMLSLIHIYCAQWPARLSLR